MDPMLTRIGGAYIPPTKPRIMQAQITDKSSLAFQWDADDAATPTFTHISIQPLLH